MATLSKLSNWFIEDVSHPDTHLASRTMVIGHFQIHLDTRDVIVEGKVLRLSDQEFELLVFLGKHPKHFVTPHTSLSTRWDKSKVGRTDFLRVLESLQNKLEAAGVKGRYIRIEPWYLYSFDATAE
jgi:DNA-binding response OmpR family regulator